MSRMRRCGVTVAETLVALAIVGLVITVLYSFLSRVFATNKPSVTRMTGASFVRQDVRLAFQKLMDRLEEGIEILSPAPGRAGASLEFKDVLNHSVALELNARAELVSARVKGGAHVEETAPDEVKTARGDTVREGRPVKVPGVKKVVFQVLSPTLVTIILTVTDADQTGHLVATARLRNSRLADR